MSLLKKWITKIFRGSMSKESLPPAPAKINVSDIEKKIDEVVYRMLIHHGGDKNYLIIHRGVLEYWQSVIKAICFAESNFNPNEKYFEKTMGYFSAGLMQLSYEDCIYYNFYLDREKGEIFDIEKNIQLGMIILNRLVKNHGTFVFNSGNYWAVLQPKNKRHSVFLNKFNEYYQGGI